MSKVKLFEIRVYVAVAFTLAFLLAGVSALHAGPRIKPGLRVAILDIDGEFGASAGGARITAASTASALGLDEETVLQPHLDFDWEKWHLWLLGFKADYSGSGTTEATIQLGDFLPIAFNTPVVTDVEFTYLTANFIYDIIPTKFFDIGIGLGGGMVKYRMAFQSKRSPLRASKDNTLPFAFPMARIAQEIRRFGLMGTVGGILVKYGNHDISYFQVDLSASYRIFGKEEGLMGHLTLGYQYLSLDYEYFGQGEIVIIDIALDGPYLGFALSF
jgi:hypothetical protein